MKTNIVLTGFMAVGKTSIARVLAELLGHKYISTDREIERKAGMTVSSIFEKEGEIRFRELEIETVKKISQQEYMVIDCGGGVVLNTINISRLKANSVIIYLRADSEEIIDRLSGQPDIRPLVRDKKLVDIIGLMKQREPFYRYAADIRMNTSKRDIRQMAEKIVKELKKREDFSF
jgi:shikimate kinase